MAQSSLITTTSTVKKYLIYFGIFAVVVIILQICVNVIGGIFKYSPTANNYFYLDANYSFGQIDLPAIPSLTLAADSKPTYTTDNDLPVLPYKTVNVYQANEPREIFGSENMATELSKRFGFTTDFTRDQNNSSQLDWSEKGRTFTFDKVKQKITFRNIQAPITVVGFSKDLTYYQQHASEFVAQLNLTRPTLDLTHVSIDFLVKTNNTFTQAKSQNSAQYLEIRVFRKFEAVSVKKDKSGNQLDKNAKPVSADSVLNDYLSAPLVIVVTNNQAESFTPEQLVTIDFADYQFGTTPGVYNLYTPVEAWNNIKSGNGGLRFLSEYGFNPYTVGRVNGQDALSFTASYQKVQLAYLEPDNWTGYIYPIYIFSGRARLADSPNQDNADFVYYTYAMKPAPSNASSTPSP